MKTNDISSANSASAPVVVAQAKADTKKLSFWVSQLFILLATILGVYLASSQGFKQALAYGNIQSDKANYYLRKSMRDEIAKNLKPVREYLERISTGSPSARNQPVVMDTFVWECLKSSSSTLETPSDLLSEGRQFYTDVADIQKKVADSTYALGQGKEKMEAVLNHMEKNVLPKFDSNLKSIKSRLLARGVEL